MNVCAAKKLTKALPILLCLFLVGCTRPIAPTPTAPVAPTAASTDSSSTPALDTPTASPLGQTSSSISTTLPQATEDTENFVAYCNLVTKTFAIIKQAQNTVFSDNSTEIDLHSRIQTAQSLMGKASDTYNNQAFSFSGFSDIDSLMRDGMYEDSTAFDYRELRESTSDRDMAADYNAKGEKAYLDAGEDFQKVLQAIHDHHEQLKGEIMSSQ